MVDSLHPGDDVMEKVLAANGAAGLPQIDVTPMLGKFLYLLATIQGSKRILEVETLGGYSTIWFARALPKDGKIVTLEAMEKHAEVARKNISNAGFSGQVEFRLAPALESLAAMYEEGVEPFDFIFLDADKENNDSYLKWALRLSRPGTVIVCDNVVRNGDVLDAGTSDPNVRGVRRFFEVAASEPRFFATGIQTVGAKGYDGFVMGIVKC
jgi:predicted O-methyltransferase YrrM